MCIVAGPVYAEDVAWYRSDSTKWPKKVLKEYKNYWVELTKDGFEEIVTSDNYLPQAKLDRKIISRLLKKGPVEVKPVFIKPIKVHKRGPEYAIAADFIDRQKSVIRRETGCYFVRLEGSTLRFLNYIGDCLNN
jgi:hypothetical protein